MPGLAISNPVAGLDGVEFRGTRNAVEHRFVLHREALEEIEYKPFDTPDALLQAFELHRGLIARVAGQALADRQDAAPSDQPILLNSLLL